ncbi:MAG TPA: phosphoenolpyruvate--protein phosphotransferase [Puia sp.]|nr:phosphoenolpyruvate--protein phosphotransferase [Puia sp.]
MKGIGVSPGISIGRACVIRKKAAVLTGVLLNDEAAVLADISAYDAAVKAAVQEVEILIDRGRSSLPQESLDILETQIEFLGDPQIRNNVVRKISVDKKNVNDALIEVIRDTVQLFKNMQDDYLSARTSDIQDIGDRILKHLPVSGMSDVSGGSASSGVTATSGAFGPSGQMSGQPLAPDTILIAEDITPSDTITMDTTQVIGFATVAGGKTSHAAIIAKSRGIPAVVGCGEDLSIIADQDMIILDGLSGLVLVNPDSGTIAEYQLKKAAYGQQAGLLSALAGVPACTTDGVVIKLLGNIGDAGDLLQLFDKGGEGVGLLRTELLFMGRNSFPTEEEQFEFYKKIALGAGIKPVTVRTLDIGGDKQLSYFGLPTEQNPFLGYRAIRICLDREDLFITQLKAILRASAFGNLTILFPMISNIRELRLAKVVLAKAKSELTARHQAFDPKIATGIMIEIPSAALTADLLAAEADFFSIGTNDLCQYTLAVDRMNEKVKDLYEPFDPGMLRLIRFTIEQGLKNNIPVALCGEMASDPLATLLLLGLGLTEFSMSAASIPSIKNIINNNSLSKAKEIAKKVMGMDNSQDIITYLQEVNS